MGVPEEAGGDGAGLVGLALVTEQVGRHLAPVPLVEVVAAARLLARVGSDASTDWLTAAMNGDRLITLALHPAEAGVRQLVPAGAVADAAVALVGDDLVVALRARRGGLPPTRVGHRWGGGTWRARRQSARSCAPAGQQSRR